MGVFRDLLGSFQFSCKIRVSRFLMQDETFQFSHARWDILVPHPRWDLGFLILHETFGFSYPTWDFWVFLSYMRFSVFLSYIRLFVLSIKKQKQIIQFDQVWTSLIWFDKVYQFDQVRTSLNKFDHIWTSLIYLVQV